ALVATVYYALKALLDPAIPANGGFYRAIRVTAPEGSIVNAEPPAPVAWRTQTCQRIADVIFGALAPALPGEVIAATNGANSAWVFSGVDPRTGQYYVYLETIGGGSGARATKDGLDGVQVHITNTSNLPAAGMGMPSRSSRRAPAATALPPSARGRSRSAICSRRRLRRRHRLEERVTKRPVCFGRPIEVPYSLRPRLVVDEPSRQRPFANTFD